MMSSVNIKASRLKFCKVDSVNLRIAEENEAMRSFPLRTIKVLVVIGDAKDGLDVLLNCAEKGIPVQFIHENGRFGCRLQMLDDRRSLLADWLPHVDANRTWLGAYKTWHYEVTTRVILRSWARLERWQDLGKIRDQIGRDILKSKNLEITLFEELLAWLDSLLKIDLLAVLEVRGVQAGSEAAQRLLQDLLPPYSVWLACTWLKDQRPLLPGHNTAEQAIALYGRLIPKLKENMSLELKELVSIFEKMV
ncbi:MAG: hypothetical protein HKM02_08110 [Pseudomonadales bacterium]|nr:hypothetical protein [Pseudomonadales bacterium]